jgi:transglutaminase-like putative cysteine protease
MVKWTRQGRRDLTIRQLAAGLIQGVTAKDFTSEVDTIFQWVRDNIRYTLDINNVETLQTPINTLNFGYGDCDDMSMLLAAMLESVGHPCQFVAVALEEADQFDHVFVRTMIGDNWVSLDPTEPNAMGWEPPGIVSWLIYYI